MTDTPAVDQIPPGGEPMPHFSWTSWTPDEVMRRLRGVDVPWAFVGGWALDLFRGSVSREHEDVEIAVPKARFWAIRDALPELEFMIVGAGRKWSLSDPYAELFQRNAYGLPYTIPEVVLLFKTKAARPKDERDLEGVLPLLSPVSRRWLVDAIERVHPGHPWITRIP